MPLQHTNHISHTRSETQKATLPTVDTPPDYPRPAAPGEGEQPPPHHQEEEVPKKEQGTGADEHERRLQESIYRKMEQNRPKKEFQSGPRNVNAGGRISQPAGKTFAV